MDSLKAGIGLRGYGQQDPKVAYKKEGTELFHEKLLPAVENEVASLILRIQARRPEESQGEGDEQPQEGGLMPRGMVRAGQAVPGGGPTAPTPEQLAALRQRMQQQNARRAMRPQVPASNAFDVMRRGQGGAGGGGSTQEASPAPASAPTGFEGTGRNDPCPCGSGKKFKKCHGAG